MSVQLCAALLSLHRQARGDFYARSELSDLEQALLVCSKPDILSAAKIESCYKALPKRLAQKSLQYLTFLGISAEVPATEQEVYVTGTKGHKKLKSHTKSHMTPPIKRIGVMWLFSISLFVIESQISFFLN